ncbi:hypothetical protein BOTBODRAFT_143162 [Botryobasidium botryosum FD-172 SS1]|uniref:Uncharacterized protein n=1 Tax=Botryobasidium botryosum (strain FD-172 SS1) TaxID=930990 RepID=A0A067N410_BOTB1|nr:hypothetical protein BOTBODRAFT_143162 [Botryobasidium botryosum FD-172 SS1]
MSSGCLEPNHDIAGIGIRVSIYAQTFPSSPPSFSWWTERLGVYHALIVFNLSWINALNYFLYYSALLKPATSVPILQFLHVSAMAALDIWVWSKVAVFGSQPECTPHTLYVLFGKSIPVVDNPLQIASIVLYSITVLPALNGIYIVIGVWACGLVVLLITLALARLKIPIHDHKVESLMVYVPMVLYAAAINILFVVDTELMIRRDAGLTQPGESQQTFGQTLAMLVLFVPLIDIVKKARVLLKASRILC